MTRTRQASLGSLLLLAILLPGALLYAADVVYKTDGGRLRGEIIAETSKGVKIKTLGGTYFVPRDEILRVERAGDVFREFESRRDKLSQHDAEGWYALGQWAQDQELYPQAVDCFHVVLGIDSDHEDARWELGYRKLSGRWVTEAEYFEAKGYLRWQDRWVSEEDYQKLEAGLVEVDGHWITREAAEAAEQQQREEARRTGKKPKRPKQPARDAGRGEDGERKRVRRGFPWAAGPLGGQVGLPPLSEEERAAQLEANKTKGRWKIARSTKYYDIYSNGPAKEVKQLGVLMDLMCEEYKRIFKFEAEITRPFPIHLYGSQREFQSRTGKGPGTGGFYDGHKIVAFHGKLGGLTTESVLFHEGTHQFQGLVLGRNMWRAKIWLIEGLAVFFEASEAKGKRLQTGAIPRSRLANVKRALQSGNYVRLNDLIRMEQAQFGALHYAHAWSLIYFLVNGTKGGKKRFVEYWNRTKDGEDGVKLFEELFNRPMSEIEAAWKDYVLKLG